MTTAIHNALPGADHFSSSPIDSPSYTSLASLDTSIPYSDALRADSTYTHRGYQHPYSASAPSSAPPSPQLTHSSFSRGPSYASTPASSVSLSTRSHFDEDDEDDDMLFPSYETSTTQRKGTYIPQPDPIEEEPTSHPPTPPHNPSDPPKDDHAVVSEPSRHVDYLSHDWKEEDIWSSWSYVVHRRKEINNSTRLENASWRTWTKSKNALKTISPESLNWLKDCDTTWLYGPLQTPNRRSLMNTTPPPSRLSRSSSFMTKKPILKKKSASAVMLERSLSQHTLLARASEILRSQQSSPALLGKPVYRRHTSDFNLAPYSGSSALNTPAVEDNPGFSETRSSVAFPDPLTPNECKHVAFHEEVRQVQAVDSEDDDKEEEAEESVFEDDEDDDGGLMMAPVKFRGSKTTTPRGSFSNENKTIMPLPPTTLKSRTETPDQEQPGLWPHGRTLSPSPSQETLRPSRPNQNFLIDDDPEVVDEPWQPREYSDDSRSPYEEEGEPSRTMRRTPSGMFMPYDEHEEEAAMNNHLFGRAVYAVNTIRDIAHVVWNVGWHRDKDNPQGSQGTSRQVQQ